MKLITYPVENIKEEENNLIFEAGIKHVDNKRRINWEGLVISIPKEHWKNDGITLAVIGLEDRKGSEYVLCLAIPDLCYCGTIEVRVSRSQLLKWLNVDGQKLDHSFRGIYFSSTYDVLVSLPRTITLNEKEVIIQTGFAKTLGKLSAESVLIKGEHPLDL